MAHQYQFYLLIVFIASCYTESQLGIEPCTMENIVKILEVPVVGERHVLNFRFGERVRGDRRLAQKSEYYTFPKPHNHRYNLWFPSSGLGSIITMLDIWVDITSYESKAYIIDGGIGQRKIKVYIETNDTTLFSYRARIYGHD